MKANYHTHTARCLHALGTERDYVQEAVRAGVSVLGFSDHAPFPDQDYGQRMAYGELGEYLAAIDGLRGEYGSRITLYRGLEIEYLPQYRSYYEELLSKEKLDYLILGEHFFPDAQGELHNIYFARSTKEFLDYARMVAEGLETGFFRMAAHPDVFAYGQFSWDRNCDEASDRIIEAAVRTGAVLEYNANGMRRGICDYPDGPRYMYPHQNFWVRAAKAGVPAIIGSDCHEPAQVWDGNMAAAREQLLALGITPLECLEGLGPAPR